MPLNCTVSCTILDDATYTQSFDSGYDAHGTVSSGGKQQAYIYRARSTDEIDRMRTKSRYFFSSHFLRL